MLSRDLNKEDIVEHFDFCGEITDAYLLKDVQQKKGYYTEVSRGKCFVTFSNPKGAKNALKLHGSKIAGKKIRVNYSYDRGEQGGKGGNDSKGNGLALAVVAGTGSGGKGGKGKSAGRGYHMPNTCGKGPTSMGDGGYNNDDSRKLHSASTSNGNGGGPPHAEGPPSRPDAQNS